MSFVELSICLYMYQILVENPIKSVIEVSKFLFDLPHFHQVTSKFVYDLKTYLDQNPIFSHTTSTFRFDLEK